MAWRHVAKDLNFPAQSRNSNGAGHLQSLTVTYNHFQSLTVTYSPLSHLQSLKSLKSLKSLTVTLTYIHFQLT